MTRDHFHDGVSEQLKWYVYRLVDPRNGGTFYVGKGQGNRVFDHARGLALDEEDEIVDPKLQRIREVGDRMQMLPFMGNHSPPPRTLPA